MRRLLVLPVVVVVALSGCIVVRSPEPAEPAPPATPALPAAEREPVTVGADGDGNSEKFILTGDYKVVWETFGDCFYGADLEDGGGSLFSASDVTAGETFVYGVDGSYYVQMITGPAPNCGWSVTFEPV